MTPFGARIRELRRQRGVTLKHMAEQLQISAAYLSALEHGRRGKPSPILVDQICAFFHIIWDDADEMRRLARISHPRVVLDTAGLSPRATEFANRLAARIGDLDERRLGRLLTELDAPAPAPRKRRR
ncbi:MAG: helix-turn-helix transcriptional regulator [Alphaproteobacteria bacterium]